MRNRYFYYNTKELKQAWGEWLSGLAVWHWYATLTFRDPSPGETSRGYNKRGIGYAKRAWVLFIQSLPVIFSQIYWVRMFEYQHWRGVPHIHALIGGVQDLRRDEAWKWWFDRYGIARILPYDPGLGAGYYLCKYVTKELADIEFSANLGSLGIAGA